MKQTELMSWIKAEKVDFYSKFHIYLSKNFAFWGLKQDNGEYIWFCVMNESCQAGFILEYMAKTKSSDSEIQSHCLSILNIYV